MHALVQTSAGYGCACRVGTSPVAVRILVGVVAVLRATLIYGEVTAAEAWEPRRPSWLRRAPAAEQPARQLAHAA
jgi:hypothetical protein